MTESTRNQEPTSCLVITELFLPTKGGTAVWFAEVYRRLGGRDIHIVTADVPHAHDFDRSHANTVHRVSLRRYRWMKPESLAMYCRLLWHSLVVGWRNRPATIHAGRVLPEGLMAWGVARALGKPLIIYAHGEEITTWRTFFKRQAMIFTYRRADRVIANSRFTSNLLVELGVAPSRIALISPGVDIEMFYPGNGADFRQRLGIKEGQSLILSVGRLSRRKGFDQVIRSLPALLAAKIDVHYAVIGIGEDAGYLQSLAKNLGVENRVHMLAHQSSADLPRWYRAADVFAMPNRNVNGDTEGFGLVFLEAAASGKPSVAGTDGGTGDAVIDGVTGFRVDGASISELSSALMRLLGDPEVSRELGENGLKRARERYSWDAVARATRALVSEVALRPHNH